MSPTSEFMTEVSLAHSYQELFQVTGPLPSRSYFGPRTCGGGITNVIEVGGALNQGFPFSPLLPHFRGLLDGVKYKFLDCIPPRHQ